MPAMFQAAGLGNATVVPNLNGVFTANKVKLAFSTGGAAGAAQGGGIRISGVLVQSVNFQYQQQITRLYEIGDMQQAGGTNNMYYIVGRTQGTAGVQRVVGPKATIKEVYQQYGDACKACVNDLVLDFNESACCSGGQVGVVDTKLKFTLKFCVLQQIGAALNSNDMIVNETSSIMFSDLQYE